MFIGHFAVGLLSKGKNVMPSLAMFFIAVQLLDLIWPILVLFGIETFTIDPGNTALTNLNFEYYPYSHSLMAALIWSILLGTIYYFFSKNKNGSILLGGLVMSHWILDYISHRPDLPLSPFTDYKVGLGLWNHPIIEIIFELLIFGIGAFFYFKFANPKRRIAFWSLIGFLVVVHLMNLFGPPPPNISAVAWSANSMWIIIIWAWWIEKKKSASQ